MSAGIVMDNNSTITYCSRMIGTTQGYMIYKYQLFALIQCLKNGKLDLVILHLPLEWHQLPNRCKQQTSNPKFRKRSQDMMEFVCFEKVEKSNVGKKGGRNFCKYRSSTGVLKFTHFDRDPYGNDLGKKLLLEGPISSNLVLSPFVIRICSPPLPLHLSALCPSSGVHWLLGMQSSTRTALH